MCDTQFHLDMDGLLLQLQAHDLARPEVFATVKNHPYDDECCSVVQGDGCVVRKERVTVTPQVTVTWAPEPF